MILLTAMKVSGSFDETVRVWDARTGHCLRVSEQPADSAALTVHTRSIVCRQAFKAMHHRGWSRCLSTLKAGYEL